jgi:hypothetical protein
VDAFLAGAEWWASHSSEVYAGRPPHQIADGAEEAATQSLRVRAAPSREAEAFVSGARWQEWATEGRANIYEYLKSATMWASDRALAWAEAERRYPC